MDSFYEQPRSAPVPVAAEIAPSSPIVPEVSLIFQNVNSNPILQNKINQANNHYMSYNAWKTRKNQPQNQHQHLDVESNKENITGSSCLTNYSNLSVFTRKQVRFESPVIQHNDSLKYQPTNVKPAFQPHRSNATSNITSSYSSDNNATKSNFVSKPFEQIYMANIPNRHLDLSIIEPIRPVRTVLQSCNETNLQNDTHLVWNKNCDIPQMILKSQDLPRRKDNYRTDTDIMEYSINTNHKNSNPLKESPRKRLNGSGVNTKEPVVDMYNYVKNYELDQQYMLPKHIRNKRENMTDNNCQKYNHITQNYNTGYDSFNSHCIHNSLQLSQPNKIINNQILIDKDSESCGSNEPPEKKDSDLKTNDSNDPAVKDLLKIIQQQNEQLILLQKQVAALLDNKSNQKQIKAPPLKQNPEFSETCITSTQIEPVNVFNKKPIDNPNTAVPKFAIDVMTSFEVSIRPPHNFPHRNKLLCKDLNHEPKIQEITEIDSNISDKEKPVPGNVLDDIRDVIDKTGSKQISDDSLSLSGSLPIQEDCPSPEHSIHVDMQDYSSDSDDESTESSSDIGWTIYNNVMGQVNNILHKAQQQTVEELYGGAIKPTSGKIKDKTLRKVKEATLRHLKSIGVTLPSISDSDDSMKTNDCVSDNADYSPTKISFAVKQLLMKYLPDEQLAKISYAQKKNIPEKTCGNTANLIKRRPEFSFATVQYMKKYNLLNSGNGPKRHTDDEQIYARVNKQTETPKVLDITALKQQPKLL